MSTAALERAVREIAERTSNLITDDTTDAQLRTLRDAAELVRVLGRMVAGRSLHQAFGAPGDWGYGKPIGDALVAIYSEPQAPDLLAAAKALLAARHDGVTVDLVMALRAAVRQEENNAAGKARSPEGGATTASRPMTGANVGSTPAPLPHSLREALEDAADMLHECALECADCNYGHGATGRGSQDEVCEECAPVREAERRAREALTPTTAPASITRLDALDIHTWTSDIAPACDRWSACLREPDDGSHIFTGRTQRDAVNELLDFYEQDNGEICE